MNVLTTKKSSSPLKRKRAAYRNPKAQSRCDRRELSKILSQIRSLFLHSVNRERLVLLWICASERNLGIIASMRSVIIRNGRKRKRPHQCKSFLLGEMSPSTTSYPMAKTIHRHGLTMKRVTRPISIPIASKTFSLCRSDCMEKRGSCLGRGRYR